MSAFRARYGASPLHLAGVLVALAVVAYALSRVFSLLPEPLSFFVWFAGAVVLHDLLFLPSYSLLGRGAAQAIAGGERPSRVRIAALNHVRIPVLLAGLALLVWFPLILATGQSTFESASGLTPDIYLGRWLALTGVLLGGSLLAFCIRLPRLRRQ